MRHAGHRQLTWVDHRRSIHRIAISLLTAAVSLTVVAACSTNGGRPSSGRTPADTGAPVGAKISVTTLPAPTTSATTSPPTTAPPPSEQPGWTVIAATAVSILSDTRTIGLPSGNGVTLVRFRAGAFRLVLQTGSGSGYAISPTERSSLLGAFNGGFKLFGGAGGLEANGQVIAPLSAGEASLVVDSNGTVHLGVWGDGLPAAGEQVVSVRQNLHPLIDGGQISPQINVLGAWGATLHGVANVARSAVGIDRGGDLVVAASMRSLPIDLAEAFSAVGVDNAMELDINPYWVQVDVAAYTGGPLRAAIPGQQRSANQYLVGWSRDYLAVIGPPA